MENGKLKVELTKFEWKKNKSISGESLRDAPRGTRADFFWTSGHSRTKKRIHTAGPLPSPGTLFPPDPVGWREKKEISNTVWTNVQNVF